LSEEVTARLEKKINPSGSIKSISTVKSAGESDKSETDVPVESPGMTVENVDSEDSGSD
jgi:hypothetical protein